MYALFPILAAASRTVTVKTAVIVAMWCVSYRCSQVARQFAVLRKFVLGHIQISVRSFATGSAEEFWVHPD